MSFDYQVFYLDGMKTNEAVTENEDGSYTIFLNNNLCDRKRIEAFYHAINHIKERDFEKEDVQEIERKAHFI